MGWGVKYKYFIYFMPYTTPRRNAKPRGSRTPRSAYKRRSYTPVRRIRTSKRLALGRNYGRHTFVRSMYQENFVLCAGGTTNTIWDFGLGFCLSNIESQVSVPGTIPTGPNTAFNNITDIVNLFEEYRIKKVRVTLIPHWNVSDTVNQTALNDAQLIPQIFYVFDQDDITPVAMQQLMQMQGVKMAMLDKPITMSFAPKPQQLAAGGVGGGAAIVQRAGNNNLWLDCDAVNTPYYGLKFNIRTGAAPTGINFAWDVKIDYVIECKGIR